MPKKLRLFVSGRTSNAAALDRSIRRICDDNFPNEFEVETTDIALHPEKAREYNIVATPMLIGDFDEPTERLIGEIANGDHLVLYLKRVIERSETGYHRPG